MKSRLAVLFLSIIICGVSFIGCTNSKESSLNKVLLGTWEEKLVTDKGLTYTDTWVFSADGQIIRGLNSRSLPAIYSATGGSEFQKENFNLGYISGTYSILQNNIISWTIKEREDMNGIKWGISIGENLKYPVTVINETEILVQRKSGTSNLKRKSN